MAKADIEIYAEELVRVERLLQHWSLVGEKRALTEIERIGILRKITDEISQHPLTFLDIIQTSFIHDGRYSVKN